MRSSLRSIPAIALLACTPAICGSRQPTAQAYQFQNVKIVAGGFISGFVAHPTAPGVIYARTDIGGTYRWDPLNKSWTPLNDSINTADWDWTGTESIALDPTNPDRLYLAQGMYTESYGQNGAFLVSNNRGVGFQSYPVPFKMGSNDNGRNGGERLQVNPFRPNELYFGSRQNGLWKSEDYAATWTQVTSFPIQSSADSVGIIFVTFDPQHPGVIYAGANQPNSIYVSKDWGGTWTLLPGQPTAFSQNQTGAQGPSPLRAILAPNGNLFITYGDGPGPNNLNAGDVWKYNTVHKTWTLITPPLDPYQTAPRGGFCGLSVDPNKPEYVAVATLDRWYPVDTIYVSSNGGSNWVSLGPLASIPNTYGNWAFPNSVIKASPWLTFGGANARFGWWQAALLIDPSNHNHFMYGTGATIFGTEDLSAAFSKPAASSPTWTVQAEGIEETAVTTLISPTSGVHLLSGMGDIGGFRHENFNVSPPEGMFTNPVLTTENSIDFAGLKPNTVARVGTGSAQLGGYSTDQGITWTPFSSMPPGLSGTTYAAGQIAVSADGATFVWAPENWLGVAAATSNDYGTTWIDNGLPSGNEFIVADKKNPNFFYATDGYGNQYYSSNKGQSFTYSTWVQGGGRLLAVNYAVAGDVWLGGSSLSHSTDFGKTWKPVGPVALSNITQMALGMPAPGAAYQSIYVWATYNGITGAFRSTDGGNTWLRVNDDAHQYGGNVSVMAADPRVYGQYFLGINGRGIIVGNIAH